MLLARYRLYDDAIPHFQTALQANPESDDVKFDLADAYFRKGQYAQALEMARQVSATGQQDDASSLLLGDIHAHLGNTAKAEEIFRDAISRNPDNDQNYLSLDPGSDFATRISAAPNKLCKKAWREFPAQGKFCGDWESSRLSKAKPDRPRNASSAPSNCCPSGPAAIQHWESSIIRRDKSTKPAKC